MTEEGGDRQKPATDGIRSGGEETCSRRSSIPTKLGVPVSHIGCLTGTGTLEAFGFLANAINHRFGSGGLDTAGSRRSDFPGMASSGSIRGDRGRHYLEA